MSSVKEPGSKCVGPVPRSHKRSIYLPMAKQTFGKGRTEVVTNDEMTIGRFIFESGWRWTRAISNEYMNLSFYDSYATQEDKRPV